VSEPEDFLTRWSRRKREAEQAPRPVEPESEARAPARDSAQANAPAAAASVDLSALPPIEEITATTDIRAYLAPGVPTDLTRAALRRAWVADPTIREFIGIAENQWDFNDPHGVPGFGPIEDIGRLVAQLLGEDEPRAAPPAIPADPAQGPALGRETGPPADAPAIVGDMALATDEQPGSLRRSEANVSANEPIAASQQAERMRMAPDLATPRGHGGALPR
jgi:hypothetical protein